MYTRNKLDAMTFVCPLLFLCFLNSFQFSISSSLVLEKHSCFTHVRTTEGGPLRPILCVAPSFIF
jgi:hypothetical protein